MQSSQPQAEIISVGTELLLGQIVDTHAPKMGRILAECGVGCRRRTTVGDNMSRLVEVLREALVRADVVITIGGLGPTQDDLTRDAIAAALDEDLVKEPEVEKRLKEFFASRNIKYSESNSRQATRPASATLIDNPNGTAPGLLCRKDGKSVVALPGPKGEFDPMAEGPVRDFLISLGGPILRSRTLRIVGIGESSVEERVRHLMQGENPTVAPYAHLGEVHLRLTASAATNDEAESLIAPVAKRIRDELGQAVFGENDTTLEEAVIHLMRRRNLTLAVAESMTGGGLGERLTSVVGAGDVFLGGVISYNPAVKSQLLQVPASVLEQFGPVSAECAIAMADGVRKITGASVGVAITGNAGPTSDVDGKPVGLTFLAVTSEDKKLVESANYRGIREDVRRRATQYALSLVRESLM